MDKFETFSGVAAPLVRLNIDTDAIIPSREMKQVSKKGLSVGMFAGWRYLSADNRTPNPDFVLNKPEYAKTEILLSGANFGCGSSREHAVWAIKEYGIRVIIAPSFSNIFYNNSIRNGLLPIRLHQDAIDRLVDYVGADPEGNVLTIDLEHCRVSAHDEVSFVFSIEETNRDILLEGADQITQTLQQMDRIDAFIGKDKIKRPWAHL